MGKVKRGRTETSTHQLKHHEKENKQNPLSQPFGGSLLQEKSKGIIQLLVDCSTAPSPTPLITLLMISPTLTTACRERFPMSSKAITNGFALSC